MLIHCIGNNSIAYDTVINANRPGIWPCHERYADRQVTPKARHNSHSELPSAKTKVVPNYPDNCEILCYTCLGCTTALASYSERDCVAHTSDSNRKT